MIVETDFLDHWKTRLLIQLTQDPAAPLLVLRLWSHCQQRKAWRFADLSDVALAAICRWEKNPAELRRVLIEAGFLDEEQADNDGVVLDVHDFEIVNQRLISNWTNGTKGGRPRTHQEPTASPSVSDRVDGIDRGDRGDGVDRKNPPTPSRKKRAKVGTLPSDQAPEVCSRMEQINALFGRQNSTVWISDELDAFKAAGLDRVTAEDFEAQVAPLRSYYGAEIPREMDFRRRDILRLLRNWGGEIDRARAWIRDNRGSQDELRHL